MKAATGENAPDEAAVKRAEQEAREKAERERAEQEAADARRIKEEEERIARETAEREEFLRQQDIQDTAGTQVYRDHVVIFLDSLPERLALRAEENARARQQREQWEAERRQRLAARGSAKR